MIPTSLCSMVLMFLPVQALVAQICSGLPSLWFLRPIFVLAGVLLIAAPVASLLGHRRAAVLCLLLAVVIPALGVMLAFVLFLPYGR